MERETAMKILKELHNKSLFAERTALETIIPELKESEAEKIRKALLNHLTKMWGNSQDDVCGIHVEDAIDWLEKQGEKKTAVIDFNAKDWYVSKVDGKIHDMTYNPTDKVGPKFKVGDWVVDNRTGVIHYIANIKGTVNGCYYVFGNDKGLLHIDNEEDYHLWTIQDAKDGDVLACGDKVTDCPFIFHNLTEELNPRSYCGVAKCQHFQYNDENCGFWCHSDEVRPATKEQRELLFKRMNEAGYEWDAEKKELKLLITNGGDFEQKQEWSEEDMSKVQRICKYLDEAKKYYADITEVRECVNWLKSLEDRVWHNSWKPSEEQMEALDDALNERGFDYNDLNSLYEQLKKF